ncbi:ankyrin repeat domain-containing protein [Wolbachia endosymbiont (group A) of Nomada goodeniana]|uniref:ankyrin repeat domain-containing protein n=1 Tax=Wolbachia endosymbiont (group A) of Nomada goodeniana TaxID=3066207 RepID=UPI003133321F
MLEVEHPIDYLKKEKTGSETLEGAQHVKQIASQRNTLRFKRSDDNPKLPENFKVEQAIGGGDCFFDSVAKGLKQLKPDMEFTVESLRKVCKDLAVGNQQLKSKIIKDAKNRHDPTTIAPDNSVSDDELWDAYLASIEYASEDIKKMKVDNPSLYQSLTSSKYGSALKVPIWGRPDIEGVLICKEYNIKLHVVEKHIVEGQEVWLHQIIDSEGSRSVDDISYNEENTIHLINRGNAHFQPILSIQRIQHKQQSPDPSDYDDEITPEEELINTVRIQHKQQSPDPSDYDDEITPEEELINTVRSTNSEEEKLIKIERLFEKEPKPNINFQGKDNDTPLHIVVRKKELKVIEWLVKNGARIDINNNRNRSPMDIAKRHGGQDIVRILESSVQSSQQVPIEEQPSIQQQLQQKRTRADSEEDKSEDSNKRPRTSFQAVEREPRGAKRTQNGQEAPSKKVKPSSQEYTKSGLVHTLHGDIYQLKLLMLFVKRGLDRGYLFKLATEMDTAEKFDDLVFQYEKNNADGIEEKVGRFLQAKHKQDESKTISVNDLLTQTKTKGEFSLQKYFISYRKIKQNREFESNQSADKTSKDFVICTNIGFKFGDKKCDLKLSEDIFDKKIDENDILNTELYRFKDNFTGKEQIVLVLKNAPDLVKLAKKLAECVLDDKFISDDRSNNDPEGNLFKSYQSALIDKVIDKESHKLSVDFVKGQQLSLETKNLRVAFEKVFNDRRKSFNLDDNPTISNLEGFTKEFAKLILENQSVKAVKVKKGKRVIKDDFDKLAGYVLIKKDGKIKFSTAFLNNDELPGNLNIFREGLRNELTDLNLDQYWFETYKDFKTCEETYVDKNNFWEKIKEKELKLFKDFGKLDTNFQSTEKFVEKFVSLLEESESKENRVVKIRRENKIISENIDKLAQHVLIEENEGIKFNQRIFDGGYDNSKLPSNLNNFVEQLRKKLSFDFNVLKEYKFYISNFPKVNLPSDSINKIEEDIKDFLKHLKFAVNQPNEVELGEIIKDELGKEFNSIDRKNVYSRFLEKMLDWMKDKEGKFFTHEEGKAFFEEIKKEIFGSIWFDVKDPVRLFTGREKELNNLHKAVQRNSKGTVISQMTSISGLGGIGKSELARKYATKYSWKYDGNVIWINAENFKSMESSFWKLAKDNRLGVPTKDRDEEDKTTESIVKEIYQFFAKRKSLFIFDNAEKNNDLNKFLPLHNLPPDANKPYILITSRDREWEDGIEKVEVDKLELEDAIEFVKKGLDISEEDDSQNQEIKSLVEEKLQCFPLAIQQAIAYIKDQRVTGEFTIANYLEKYEEKRKELLESDLFKGIDNDYERTTFTTWQITIDKIASNEQYGKLALEILNTIAYFAPENINREMFLNLAEGNEEQLKSAVRLLVKYSMVNGEQKQSVLNIHRLVQEVTRLQLKEERKEKEVLREALKLIEHINDSSHVVSVWSYVSQYNQLINDFIDSSYSTYFTYSKNTISKSSILHLIAKNGDAKTIENILTRIDPKKLSIIINARDQFNRTPLHVAAARNDRGIVEHLVKNGADVDAIDNSGWTPIQMPAASNQLEIVECLVKNNANVNIPDSYGITPLYRAVEKSSFKVVKYLAENGANINIPDKDKRTPLYRAVEKSSLEIVEYLAKRRDINIDAPHKGCTPLQRAADLDRRDIVGILLVMGAGINGTDSKGKTLLYIAAEKGNLELVKKLIEKGADVNSQKGKDGPLHIAAAKGHLDVVKTLADAKSLDKGKEVGINAKGSKGRTPVYRAVEGGHIEIVKYLVGKKGARFKKRGDDGSPLLLAAKKGKLEIVKFFLRETFTKKSKGGYLDKKGKWQKTAGKFARVGNSDVSEWAESIARLNEESYSEILTVIKEIKEKLQEENSVNLSEFEKLERKLNSRSCLPSTSVFSRRRREVSAEKCLFTWEDVDEFNLEKDENRDFGKIKVDSAKFLDYIKDLPEEKLSQLIGLVDQVEITDKSQSLINKLICNQKTMNYLSRVEKISGMTMHGMMAKNILADFLNDNYQGVAVNVGFISGGQGFAKVAEAASLKGLELASRGKFLLSRSLKAASPFLARGTSAFIVYDLINQVKEYKNGTEEALIGTVGDGIYLGVDAAEIGIEVAEGFELLEGVSSVTGPIGATIGAVVFVGTDIYMAVRRVDKIDEFIHLTGSEKFIEGLRAFIGMEPRQYIEELMEEKQLNNQLVNQGLEYLQQHSDIKRYIFPTGKQVTDSCLQVPYDAIECIRRGGLDGKWCFATQTVTKYYQECATKFQVDLNNEVLLDSKIPDIKWSRARPDDPNGGELFCLPQGDYEPAPSYGSYFCESAMGVNDLNRNKTGNYTLINLGEGDDHAKGFANSPNIFVVNDGFKKYYGGNKDDIFILQGSAIKGYLSGEAGINTLDLTSFAREEESMNVRLDIGRVEDYDQNNSLGISRINRSLGRKDKADKVFITCNSDASNIKFIDGQDGSERFKDQIEIYDENCGYEMQIVIRPNTVIHNRALEGNFHYTVPYGLGSAKVDFIYSSEDLNVNNTFTFEYEPIEIKNINVRNINVLNKTSHVITFNFAPMSNKEFNITISGASNPSYRLGNNTEIKVGNKGNLYMLQNTNEAVDEIIKAYLPVANRLSKMSFFIQSLANNETVVIGSGNYEVIHNNPLHKSHLVGNGGENIYVIDSTDKKIDRLPEVVIYDLDVESSVDTIDLRNLVQQAKGKLSNKESFELKIIKLANDLLLKGEITELKKREESLASGMKKYEYFTVRLKDGVNLYNKTHVIVNNVPMGIDFDNNEWSLKPLPLVFERDKEIIIVTSQDIEANTELITAKRAGNYKFVRENGNDLVITNAFDYNVAKNDLCTIVLSKFYETPKMATLSIKFADKEINLKDHQEKISTARDINVVKKEYKDQVYSDVFHYTGSKVSPEVMLSDQPMGHKHRHEHSRQQTRHRRHHHNKQDLSHAVGELSNQGNIAVSSSTRLSSRINDLFGWIKSSIGGLFNSKATSAEERPKTTSSISQVDAKIDVNSTIMLLDLLMRKVTGQKYISTVEQPVPLLEARGYALNITERFEKVVEQAAKGSKISMHRLNIDFMEMEKEITGKVIGGKFNEIAGVLSSYVEKACPGREAGCPGKLSSKKFDKFIAQFNKGLLNQSIQQILHNGDGTLEVGGAKKQQMSLEPQSYLSNASIQSHLTQDKAKIV